jgi:N-acetylglutamate synthase-like GNAT family acetyltransferase
MIRLATVTDYDALFSIINDAAIAYKGAIPSDCWHEPYFPMKYLKNEIANGVSFFIYEEGGTPIGCMGIQDVIDVTLIRHAYVRTDQRRKGIGGILLNHLRQKASKPVLIGTWKAATWAIRFYQKHGFVLVSEEEKNRLLRKYWTISERQVETSVVLIEKEERYGV